MQIDKFLLLQLIVSAYNWCATYYQLLRAASSFSHLIERSLIVDKTKLQEQTAVPRSYLLTRLSVFP